ncbi:SDR family oxidoreductase, partial [Chloroflexota bacterium]
FTVAAAFSFTRICLPHLRESRGCVVNIGSMAGRLIQPNFSVYGTNKAALQFLTKLMAAELAPEVRVNLIAPGSIMTDSLRGFLDEASLQKMCDLTPMKRLGEPDDIALAALYLCSPAAQWVTGKVLEVDGGTEKPSMPF